MFEIISHFSILFLWRFSVFIRVKVEVLFSLEIVHDKKDWRRTFGGFPEMSSELKFNFHDELSTAKCMIAELFIAN